MYRKCWFALGAGNTVKTRHTVCAGPHVNYTLWAKTCQELWYSALRACEILTNSSEKMERSCSRAPAWCLLRFTFLFFNLRTGSADVTVGPTAAAIIIQQTTCGWQRGLDRSEVHRPPGRHVRCRQRAAREAGKRERAKYSICQRERGRYEVRAAYEDGGNLQIYLYFLIFPVYLLYLTTCGLLAWLACGQRLNDCNSWYRGMRCWALVNSQI